MVSIGGHPNSMVDFQSYAGPGDKGLRNTELEGYQPVSRIGEVVMNSFIDSYEFTTTKDSLTRKELNAAFDGNGGGDTVEFKPMFHEWATVQPGMVCLARKKRTAVFRQYVAAETAVPVIACAACLPASEEKNYFFAGVARSKSVRTPDDGIGPTTDEFFTVSIGGMVTMLNTSGENIHPGDLVEWCFSSDKGTHNAKRARQGPRRIGITIASVSSPKIIGRALSFAKAGESIDVLLKCAPTLPIAHLPSVPTHATVHHDPHFACLLLRFQAVSNGSCAFILSHTGRAFSHIGKQVLGEGWVIGSGWSVCVFWGGRQISHPNSRHHKSILVYKKLTPIFTCHVSHTTHDSRTRHHERHALVGEQALRSGLGHRTCAFHAASDGARAPVQSSQTGFRSCLPRR